jgi:hypothetical protein
MITIMSMIFRIHNTESEPVCLVKKLDSPESVAVATEPQ